MEHDEDTPHHHKECKLCGREWICYSDCSGGCVECFTCYIKVNIQDFFIKERSIKEFIEGLYIGSIEKCPDMDLLPLEEATFKAPRWRLER